MFEDVDTAELIDTITARARAAASADAERYAAIAELQRRRIRDGVEMEYDAADAWDGLAAELSAALNIGHGRAIAESETAVVLRDKFPLVNALFLLGLLTERRVWLLVKRCDLVKDDVAARLDAALAGRIVAWGPLSEWKFEQLVDAEIGAIDPSAVHKVREQVRDRDFVVGRRTGRGVVSFWGRMTDPDAAVAIAQIRRMARSVCPDDPRTLKQRRGDAAAALFAGSPVLRCRCDNPDCPAAAAVDAAADAVQIHVITDQATLDAALARIDTDEREHAAGDAAEPGDGLHGPRTVEGELEELVEEIEEDNQHEADGRSEELDEPPVPDGDGEDEHGEGAGGGASSVPDDRVGDWSAPDFEPERVEPDPDEPPVPDPHDDTTAPGPSDPGNRTRPRRLAIIPGYGVIPPALLADLIARGATVRPIRIPGADPDPGYRPSAITEHFVRQRDLTCRAPGCDRPAEYTDIDHTIAYPAGATHAGGLKCYCRKHHLVKTFHAGWFDRQLPDGTIEITTPTGHTYTTKPGVRLLFPHWNVSTPAPTAGPAPPPGEHRSLRMPKRKRTRAQTKAARINAERARNESYGHDEPPPF